VIAGKSSVRRSRKPTIESEVVCCAHHASQGETWSLKLSKATNIFLEDNYVDLLGVPPWLAASPRQYWRR
jgi:hypothetical protein